MKKPLISVIIPTYKREKYVKQVLADLAAQTDKRFEVIVVTQGGLSGSRLASTLARTINVKTYHRKEPSIVKAKNLGILKARADIILVLDDDLRLPKDLIGKYLELYSPQNPYTPLTSTAIAGPALEEDKYIIKRGAKTFGEFSIFGELNTNYRLVKKPTLVTAVPGGNLSFKKKCWEKIGGYDEDFVGNCINEDSDFCLRLSKACGKILFDPNLAVTHLRAGGGSRSFGDSHSAQWYQDLFYNHQYFFRKHWPKCLLPLFFVYRLRQVYTCVIKYGKLRLEYIKAPIKGYYKALNFKQSL